MGSRFESFLQRLLTLEVFCSVVLLSVLIVLITAQVFLRYLFNSPLTWAEELAALLLIYISFLTGDIVYKKKAHISIDYFVEFFPPKLKAVTEIVIGVFICVCLVTLTVVSIPLIENQFGFTIAAALPLPKSFWTMPVPFIFVSMFLSTLNFIVQNIGRLRT